MSDQAPQRRLTAILAADVVGYSHMMQADEAGTLAALKFRRTEILQPLVSKHHGRIIRGWLAASYAHAGQLAEAKASLNKFLRVAKFDVMVYPGDRLKDWEGYRHAAVEYRDQRDFDHLYDGLRKAGLPE